MFSGYKIMWVYVIFDLPVVTKKAQKEAISFRNGLLDLGFEMVQFSVYTKICGSGEKVEMISKQIKTAFPHQGKVDIIAITDKQHDNIISFRGTDQNPLPKQHEQFLLF